MTGINLCGTIDMPTEKQLKYWESLKGNANGFKKGNNLGVNNAGKTRPYKERLKAKGRDVWNKGLKGVQTSWNKGNKGYRAGELNNNWKGGITPEREKQRKSLEYKLWRKSCFERDNFTCQKTGQLGGELAVHHINNFSEFPELRTSIENGITLSKKAHKEFHKIYGFKNNTKEQLYEFIRPN